jgi:uncharacterized membrane protein (DUF485 family)
MTVSPAVAIVAIMAAFILALVIVIRARGEDLPKIAQTLRRWFGR